MAIRLRQRDALSDDEEGVDTFNDLLAVVDAVSTAGSDPFARAAELCASLYGYASLKQVMPAFPWPSERDYVERMNRSAHALRRGPAPRSFCEFAASRGRGSGLGAAPALNDEQAPDAARQTRADKTLAFRPTQRSRRSSPTRLHP